MKPVSTKVMRDLDRRATEEFGIPSLLLMENAGRGAADIFSRLEPSKKTRVLIVSGKGNNGGDGFVVARHLYNRGYDVRCLLAAEASELKGDAALNYQIIKRVGIHGVSINKGDPRNPLDFEPLRKLIAESDFLIDALFGVGLDRPLGEPYRSLVDAMNDSQKRILAVDMPSGIHSDTGEVLGIAVKAFVTATLGMPKLGLHQGKGPEYAGRIELVDISLPRNLLEKV